jgi:hypothetical protein
MDSMERYKLGRRIYDDTFLAVPNPYLKTFTRVPIQKEPSVPIERPEVELLEVLEGYDHVKWLSWEELRARSITDPEKRVDFSNRGVRAITTEIITSSGARLIPSNHILNIITEDDRILEVDINVGPYKERDFQISNTQAIYGDGIYFFAHIGDSLSFESSETRFYILKYSWEGELVRAVYGELPYGFQKRDEYRRDFMRFEILDNEYRFSVINVPKGKFQQEGVKIGKCCPDKEFKYRIRLK